VLTFGWCLLLVSSTVERIFEENSTVSFTSPRVREGEKRKNRAAQPVHNLRAGQASQVLGELEAI
jgi:hypothetical protein